MVVSPMPKDAQVVLWSVVAWGTMLVASAIFLVARHHLRHRPIRSRVRGCCWCWLKASVLTIPRYRFRICSLFKCVLRRWAQLNTESARRHYHYCGGHANTILPLYDLHRTISNPKSTPIQSFLSFAPEVRNRIYRHSAPHHDLLDGLPTVALRPKKSFKATLALLQTCRQIRTEASALVFRHTLFHAGTRHPFYNYIALPVCGFLQQRHILALRNHKGVTGLRSALRDIQTRMPLLQDLYVAIDAADTFLDHWPALAGLLARATRSIPRLSLCSITIEARQSEDVEMRRSLRELGRVALQ